MVMKRLTICTLMVTALAAAFALGACSEKLTGPMSLDVPAEGIFTDELEVSFNILSGVPPFTAEVSQTAIRLAAADVTIDGRRVTARLLDNYLQIRITDSAGESAAVTVSSSNRAVRYSKISLGANRGYGCRHRFRLDFGAGAPYTIVNRDADTEAYRYRIEDDSIVCEYMSPAALQSHYVDISDCRGLVRRLDIGLGEGFDITGSQMNIELPQGAHVTFPFRWGSGWRIVQGRTDPFTFMWPAIDDSKASGPLYDTFFLVVDGAATYEFADRSGNTATLIIEIYER